MLFDNLTPVFTRYGNDSPRRGVNCSLRPVHQHNFVPTFIVVRQFGRGVADKHYRPLVFEPYMPRINVNSIAFHAVLLETPEGRYVGEMILLAELYSLRRRE